MAQQTINVGASPNDGTGTPLRTAFQYTNSNFTELYTATGPSGNNIAVPGSATITGALTVDTTTLVVNPAGYADRVGIGTATPAAALDLSGAFGTATAAAVIRNNSAASASNIAQVQFFTVNSFGGIEQVASIHGSNPNALGNNGGALVFSTSLNGTGTTPAERYRIGNDGTATWSVAGTTAMTLNSTGLLVGASASGNGEKFNALGTIVSSGQSIGGFAFNQGGFDYSTSTKNLRIFSGTSNATGSSMSFVVGTSTSFLTAMTLDASGNLLVGTTSTAGSVSNTTKTVGGVFSSINGTTASTASGSAVTLFAAPAESSYLLSAYLFGAGSASAYHVVAIVKVNGGNVAITAISSATGISISSSGLNIQATQTSGISQAVSWNVVRLS